MKTTVFLTYFKDTGKYYSSAELHVTGRAHLGTVCDKVRGLMQERKLPGLKVGHSDFGVLVDYEGVPHFLHPCTQPEGYTGAPQPADPYAVVADAITDKMLHGGSGGAPGILDIVVPSECLGCGETTVCECCPMDVERKFVKCCNPSTGVVSAQLETPDELTLDDRAAAESDLMDTSDLSGLVASGEVSVPKYDQMTREELIEACEAHDAHHQEHHAREEYAKALLTELSWMVLEHEGTSDQNDALVDRFRDLIGSSKTSDAMTKRYVLRNGRWGLYVHDLRLGRDLDMQKIVSMINEGEKCA